MVPPKHGKGKGKAGAESEDKNKDKKDKVSCPLLIMFVCANSLF